MKTTILLTCLLSFSLTQLLGQNTTHTCGYDHYIQAKCQDDLNFKKNYVDFFGFCEENFRGSNRTPEVYQVPVVFHIVWNTDSQNVPDSVILNQLSILNQDYRRQNPNANETREVFMPIAADTEIEFYLAGEDPDGNPTDGINRVETTRTSFELDIFDVNSINEVKHSETDGADAWDPEQYMNIWVCNIGAGFFGQVFGLAYPPNNSPNWPENQGAPTMGDEGIIVHYTTVGSNNEAANEDGVTENNGGRTLSHEVGHFLGLRHIWGDALFEPGCSVDDGITDTPNQEASSNYSCDFNLDSCEDPLPAQIENYMDYNPDDCLNMFSMEQAEMMRFILEEFRPGLLDNGIPISTIENKEIQNNYHFFPNPTSSYIQLSESIQSAQAELKIYESITSQLVFCQKGIDTEDKIDISHFQSGSYFFIIQDEDQVYRGRILKI